MKDIKQVQQLAQLARLELAEDTLSIHTKQLQRILSYIEILQNVDTTDVIAMSQCPSERSRLRPDEVLQEVDSNAICEQSDTFQAPWFFVPGANKTGPHS